MKFQLFFNFFESFWALFLTFWAPGPEGPGNSFSTPFPTLGPKGPGTPLWGLKGRKLLRRIEQVFSDDHDHICVTGVLWGNLGHNHMRSKSIVRGSWA